MSQFDSSVAEGEPVGFVLFSKEGKKKKDFNKK